MTISLPHKKELVQYTYQFGLLKCADC